MQNYVIAITGASGAAYGLKLIEELLKRGKDVELIVSPSGFILLKEELGIECKENTAKEIAGFLKIDSYKGTLKSFPNDNIASALASGSSLRRAMIVCPCSMGTLSRIACGVSGNLIERTADCMIKEGGKLILVPRETPLSPIHLENMLKLSRSGVTILPAMPAFYHKPKKISDMVDFMVGKILDSLGIENTLYKRWDG